MSERIKLRRFNPKLLIIVVSNPIDSALLADLNVELNEVLSSSTVPQYVLAVPEVEKIENQVGSEPLKDPKKYLSYLRHPQLELLIFTSGKDRNAIYILANLVNQIFGISRSKFFRDLKEALPHLQPAGIESAEDLKDMLPAFFFAVT